MLNLAGHGVGVRRTDEQIGTSAIMERRKAGVILADPAPKDSDRNQFADDIDRLGTGGHRLLRAKLQRRHVRMPSFLHWVDPMTDDR